MLALILYTFIGLYILFRFMVLLVNHARKRWSFKNWPQKPSLFLLGNIDLFLKFPIHSHFMNTAVEMFDKYAENRLLVVWVAYLPIAFSFNKEHSKKILSSNDPDILNKGELFYSVVNESAKNSLFTIDGEKWKLFRKILSAPFHATNFDNMIEITSKESFKIVNYLKKNPCKDLMKEMRKISISLFYSLLFEYELGDDIDQAIKLINEVTKLVTKKTSSVFIFSPAIYRFTILAAQENEYTKKMTEFRKKILKAKIESAKASIEKKSKSEELDCKANLTLIEILLRNFKDTNKDANSQWQGFTMDEIQAQLDTFLIMSVDATAGGLFFLIYHLAKYPHYQEQIYDEIQREIGDDHRNNLTVGKIKKLVFLDAFISESLRYQPLVPSVGRRFLKDFKLDDNYTLPAGTDIFISLEKILNDPEYFPEPRKFKPERFFGPQNDNLFANIPFSGGPRNCVAKKATIVIMALLVTDIIRNFQIKFAPSTPREVDRSKLLFDITYKFIGPMELQFVERK